MKLVPLADRVVLKQLEAEDKNKDLVLFLLAPHRKNHRKQK